MTPISIQETHARFVAQSAWTAPLRDFLFTQAGLEPSSLLLEVGSGTGAVTHAGTNSQQGGYGIDNNWERVAFAHQHDKVDHYVCADALRLPFSSASFDITFCHYFLLWMAKDALQALHEMERVTRPGGMVLAIAEPDHTVRIDYPYELSTLGTLQTQALQHQGVQVDMGRRLPELFAQAQLTDIRFGQAGFQMNPGEIPSWLDSEWQTLRADLELSGLTQTEFAHLHEVDMFAWQKGIRVLQVPTFYAMGRVK